MSRNINMYSCVIVYLTNINIMTEYITKCL